MKIPKKKNGKKLIKFFIDLKLNEIVKFSKQKALSVNQMQTNIPFKPELLDLYRLYNFVLENKRTTVMEFGSGWSSLIFVLALNKLKKKYFNEVKKLRRNNPFELFIVDNEKKYLKLTKKRINNYFKKNKIKNIIKIHYCFSKVKMTEFNGSYCTTYNNFPLCNPDFFYLDGPGQFSVINKINGFSTAHKDMMPMVSDINKIEPFLTPGTIIVTDGRGANAKFLKDNFKKKWLYKYQKDFDQHLLYLDDPVLGKLNKAQLRFYKKK